MPKNIVGMDANSVLSSERRQNDPKRVLEVISRLTGCGCMTIDSCGNIADCDGSCGCNCPMSCSQDCLTAHKHASYQAERFGGKYIYFCPAGLVFCIAQIMGERESNFLVVGPVMATDSDNYIPGDLTEPFRADASLSEEMRRFTAALKYLPADSITCMSDLAYIAANHISGYEYKKLITRQEKLKQQQEIGDYVQSVKARMLLGPEGFAPYPYDKEKKLTYAIMTGNEADARKYLNEILGHIFLASANNLDAIKIRSMELTVVISRAALDGGADMNNIYQINLQYISDFFSLGTIEDVCYALTRILRKFTEETFNLTQVKHLDLISKAISYIRANYMHKITLEDVAERVFLSPSYLSKIFKDEMGANFNSYLSLVRIEKSRVLLLSPELSISEIAELCGFFDQSYFNKVFKKATGITPKKFRETRGGVEPK